MQPADARPRPSLGEAVRLLGEPGLRKLILVAALLALMTVSDGFLYLLVQERTGLPIGLFPILFVATALVYMVLAVPVGRAADRWGRGRVLTIGYGLLAIVYVLMLLPSANPVLELAIFLLALGAYYAATDGVLMALASTVLPERVRASGLALVTTGTSIGRLISSVAFGALWVALGPQLAIVAFLIGLAVSLAVALVVLPRVGQAGEGATDGAAA
jgi:MFS family permease